jgi:hypothetical protein
MSEKKFTPIEAAMAVLNKAKELYGASTLAKAEHQAHPGPTSAIPAYGAAKQAESEAHLRSPEGDAQRKEQNSKMMKGHIKLAKFVGRMDAKKESMGKSETGHEKGVATKPNPNFKEGVSSSGASVRLGDEGQAKKESVGRMMDSSKIKPKLPS